MKSDSKLLSTIIKTLTTSLCVALMHTAALCQVSVVGHTPTLGAYLGWNGPQDLDFKTNNILRMQLMETQTSTINGFSGISQGGFVGISDELNFFNPGGTGPFSMLHINGDNAGANPQHAGWRPWMRYGMTVTSNRDLMYVGHLDRGLTDETDAVITWSDNTFGPQGPDNLRFIFTSGDGTATPGDEDSFYGLEAGRFSGQGRFGCGDFSASGANEQPTQQLDVNGKVRVRDVPEGSHHVLITGRQEDAVGDYVLHHLAFSNNPGEVLAGDGTWVDGSGSLCDWNIVNAGQDVATGYAGACVEGNVGIGNLPPGGSKLFVVDELNLPNQMGVEVRTEASAWSNLIGVSSEIASVGPTGRITGVYGKASNGKAPFGGRFESIGDAESLSQPAVGVFGRAVASGTMVAGYNSIGVYGLGESSVECDRPIGVYGEARNSVCGGGAAGYFAGQVYEMEPSIYLSDQNIKDNIQVIDGATSLLNNLVPSTYTYTQAGLIGQYLSDELAYGFVAQQVQEVLPNTVVSFPQPIQMNEDGDLVTEEGELLGIRYNDFIPLLVAGFQEQTTTIDSLKNIVNSQNETLAQVLDQLDALQEQIDGCCNAGRSSSGSSPMNSEEQKPVLGENVLNQNTPNPFHSQTTISYKLEQGGKVMLNIFDRNGKPLATLVEAEQHAGTYRYQWDASGLPAGVYNYALYVDGELLVKKAIKLAD